MRSRKTKGGKKAICKIVYEKKGDKKGILRYDCKENDNFEIRNRRTISAWQIFIRNNYNSVDAELGGNASTRDVIKELSRRYKQPPTVSLKLRPRKKQPDIEVIREKRITSLDRPIPNPPVQREYIAPRISRESDEAKLKRVRKSIKKVVKLEEKIERKREPTRDDIEEVKEAIEEALDEIEILEKPPPIPPLPKGYEGERIFSDDIFIEDKPPPSTSRRSRLPRNVPLDLPMVRHPRKPNPKSHHPSFPGSNIYALGNSKSKKVKKGLMKRY